MMPIRLGVNRIVHQIRSRGHDTEEEEGDESMKRNVPTAQKTRSSWRHEDEHVLDPLARPHGRHQMSN
jgi:hypothetical protein